MAKPAWSIKTVTALQVAGAIYVLDSVDELNGEDLATIAYRMSEQFDFTDIERDIFIAQATGSKL